MSVEESIRNLERGGHDDHARFLQNIHNSERFTIADVEDHSENHYIDIRLDDSIEIHIRYDTSMAQELGEGDFGRNNQVISQQIRQLSGEGLGILFLVGRDPFPPIDSECRNALQNNKVIFWAYDMKVANRAGTTVDAHGPAEFREQVTNIIKAAGLGVGRYNSIQ